MITGKCR